MMSLPTFFKCSIHLLYAKIPDYLGLQQIKLLKASGSSTIAVCLLLVVQEGFLRRTQSFLDVHKAQHQINLRNVSLQTVAISKSLWIY